MHSPVVLALLGLHLGVSGSLVVPLHSTIPREPSQYKCRCASTVLLAKKKKSSPTKLGAPGPKKGPTAQTPPGLRDRLVTEAAKDVRDLDLINEVVKTLEQQPLPPQGPARALRGDWRLWFASAAPPVAAVTTGTAGGQFAVTEGVVLRFDKASMKAIEAVRQFGVLGGNAKLELQGRYTVDGDELRLRYSYYLDANGAEKEAAASHVSRVSHASSDLLVLRFDGDYLVFARLPSEKELNACLDEWGIGPQAEKADAEAAAKKPLVPGLSLPKVPLPDLKLPWK